MKNEWNNLEGMRNQKRSKNKRKIDREDENIIEWEKI